MKRKTRKIFNNIKNSKLKNRIIINLKKEKEKNEKMKIDGKCKYLTKSGRCKLSSKDPETGFFEKCVFLNGFHPCNLSLKQLKEKRQYLQKAQFLCIALSRCNCKEDKEQKVKIADEVQKEMRKIDVKIKVLARKAK